MKKQIETNSEDKKVNIQPDSRPKRYIFSLPSNFGGFGDLLLPTEEPKYNNVN